MSFDKGRIMLRLYLLVWVWMEMRKRMPSCMAYLTPTAYIISCYLMRIVIICGNYSIGLFYLHVYFLCYALRDTFAVPPSRYLFTSANERRNLAGNRWPFWSCRCRRKRFDAILVVLSVCRIVTYQCSTNTYRYRSSLFLPFISVSFLRIIVPLVRIHIECLLGG